MHGRLPDFIIAGVEKTGSTSLHDYISQHPEVYMCTPKEPDFFLNDDYGKKVDTYCNLFQDASDHESLGEASVSYFYDPETADRINQILPDAKIIVTLRHPAERAYSHFNMLLDRGVVSKSSYDAVVRKAIQESSFDNTGIPTSRYFNSLREYKKIFEERLLVLIYRDYKLNTQKTMETIFYHIGVDASFKPDTQYNLNKTKRPKYALLNNFIWQGSVPKDLFKKIVPNGVISATRNIIRNLNKEPIPPLSDEARTLIISHLIEDIEQTEALLNRDLSHWKE